MTTTKEILDNELMKEILSIRIDTVWRMLALRAEDRLPLLDEEGATGHLDNKGAIFLNGGLVFEDSDKSRIRPQPLKELDLPDFRSAVRASMAYDNATLLYPDGLAWGVNLDNGFFADISGNTLADKEAATKNSPVLQKRPPSKISSDDISRSYSPVYIQPPYGSRTKLSSCMAVCLIEPRMYYLKCRTRYALRGSMANVVWQNIRTTRKAIRAEDGTVLAPPHLVVCHSTRYRKEILGGVTRILGLGEFGEFAALTLEEATPALLKEAGGEHSDFRDSEIVAEHADCRAVVVLRVFPRTNPGKRLRTHETVIVDPEEDLGIDVAYLGRKARERYEGY